jgi:hypothetical protein
MMCNEVEIRGDFVEFATLVVATLCKPVSLGDAGQTQPKELSFV